MSVEEKILKTKMMTYENTTAKMLVKRYVNIILWKNTGVTFIVIMISEIRIIPLLY